MSRPVLCDYEAQVLKGLRDGGLQWGAALAAALETLEGAGLAVVVYEPQGIRYEISDAGREHLAINH